jgi:dihydrofolate reductase
MKFALSFALIFISSLAWAQVDCNDLLSHRLEKLKTFDNLKVERSIIVTNDVLLGRRSWFWGHRKSPWPGYEDQRVLVVIPGRRTAVSKDDREPFFSNQTILSQKTFEAHLPELKDNLNLLLSLSEKSGWEWGSFALVVADPQGQLHLIFNAFPYTSKRPDKIQFKALLQGMNEAVLAVQASMPTIGDNNWKVRELWSIHTHPGGFSPLSPTDIRFGQNQFDTFFSKSLTIRDIAVTVDRPTIFSMNREATEPTVEYFINNKQGWQVKKLEVVNGLVQVAP